jgi:hypothetical protein
MEPTPEISPKLAKLQLVAFSFLYSLHLKNIISPEMIIHILPLLSDIHFLQSLTSSSIKNKFIVFNKNNKFPFNRNTTHDTHRFYYLSDSTQKLKN